MPRRNKSGELTQNEQLDSLQTDNDALQVAESLMGSGMSGDLVINAITTEPTPEPTTDAWDYTVEFELVDGDGNRHTWFSGDLAAAIADTGGGTASVDDATPTLENGFGSVVVSGTEATWADTETATLTLSGTVMGYSLTEVEWVVTFTAGE